MTARDWHPPLPWDPRWLTAAEQELVTTNMGLAGAVAVKFAHRAGDYRAHIDDMMGVAMIGLVTAATKYDPERSKFSTYGFVGARQACLHAEKVRRSFGGRILDSSFRPTLEIPDFLDQLPARPDNEPQEPEQIALLRTAIDRLPARLADIIRRRLNGDTLEAIGRDLSVTKERVRQLEMQAKRQLEKALLGQFSA